MRVLAFLLLASACTFQTEALDGALGTSCGHYESGSLVSTKCVMAPEQTGECFVSATGACGQRDTIWPEGTRLTQWCPIGNRGEPTIELLDCD